MNITMLEPAQGESGSDITMYVEGGPSNPTDILVEVGGTICVDGTSALDVNGNGTIAFKVSPNCPAGEVQVTLRLANEAGDWATAEAPQPFSVRPSMMSVSPPTVSLTGQITITGVNLATPQSVKINTAAVANLTSTANALRFKPGPSSRAGTSQPIYLVYPGMPQILAGRITLTS